MKKKENKENTKELVKDLLNRIVAVASDSEDTFSQNTAQLAQTLLDDLDKTDDEDYYDSDEYYNSNC